MSETWQRRWGDRRRVRKQQRQRWWMNHAAVECENEDSNDHLKIDR